MDIGLGTQFTINDRPELSTATTETIWLRISILPPYPAVVTKPPHARTSDHVAGMEK